MLMVLDPDAGSVNPLFAVILMAGVDVTAPSWKVLSEPPSRVRPPSVRVPPLRASNAPVFLISTLPEMVPVMFA